MFGGWKAGKNLMNDTTYKHQTCTVMLLRTLTIAVSQC